MLLVKWTNLLLIIHHYQATGIQGTGSDIIGKITSYQPFDEQCKGNRVCKHWMRSIQQMREYGDAEQVDRIIQALEAKDSSKVNETIVKINAFVHNVQRTSVIHDSLPTNFYQSLPKMISLIKTIKDPETQIKLLTALDLSVPDFKLSYKSFNRSHIGKVKQWQTQMETLLGVSRVLLLDYHFPFDDSGRSHLSKETIAMCFFTYSILMHRLYYDDVWIKKDKESRYSDLVIPLNKKIMKEIERRIFSTIASFNVSKLFVEIGMNSESHDTIFIAGRIGVRIVIDFYNSNVWEKAMLAILEKQRENRREMARGYVH